QTGKNPLGAAGGGLAFYFTDAIDVITGPVFYFDKGYQPGNASWLWTLQLDVDVTIFAPKPSSGPAESAPPAATPPPATPPPTRAATRPSALLGAGAIPRRVLPGICLAGLGGPMVAPWPVAGPAGAQETAQPPPTTPHWYEEVELHGFISFAANVNFNPPPP